MMNSSDWEKGGPETDCRGVEMNSTLPQQGSIGDCVGCAACRHPNALQP